MKEYMREKPENADAYDWDGFNDWADSEGVGDEYTDDWMPWWKCWKAAYIRCMNGH